MMAHVRVWMLSETQRETGESRTGDRLVRQTDEGHIDVPSVVRLSGLHFLYLLEK